jgi:hypothetical protein
MNLLPPGYDAWRLRGPDEHEEVGTEWKDRCNRYPAPEDAEDEDAPRGYRPRPCTGMMDNNEGVIVCDTCGEVG